MTKNIDNEVPLRESEDASTPKGAMKPGKKRLTKPACNQPISQEKAGFVTYSTYDCCAVSGTRERALPLESMKR
jgi:hypothetical protein